MPLNKFVKHFFQISIAVVVSVTALYWLGPVVLNAAFDFQATRDEIARIVRKRTGRELKLEGEVHFRLRTLTPGFRLTDVRFQNASWSRLPDMLRLKSLEVEIGVLPLLLHGELDIKTFELVDGELFLETDRDGRGNWQFAASADSSSAKHETGGASRENDPLWLLEELRIRGSTLSYSDGKTGRVRTVEIDSARLTLDAEKIAGDAAVRYGKSDLSGELEFRRDPRALSGRIQSRVLNLDDLVEKESRVRREARARRGRPQPAREPLPFDDLLEFTAKLDWEIEELRRGPWRFDILKLHATLDDGRFSLHPLTGSFAGGEFDARMNAGARDRSLSLAFDIQNLNLVKILKDAKERPLADAKLRARLRLNSAGSNLAALRKNIRGAIALESGAVTIDQPVFFASVGSEAAGAIRTWMNPLPTLDCFVARFDFQNGVGSSKTVLLDTNDAALLGAGNLDLVGDQLDLVFTLHSKKLSAFSLASNVPIRLRGPFARPQVHVADRDIVKKIFLSALELPALPVELIESIYDTGVAPGKSLCPAARRKAAAGFP